MGNEVYEENLSQHHFLQHKSYMNSTWFKPKPLQWENRR